MGGQCISQRAQLGAQLSPRAVGWRRGGREAQQGEDICMHIADSLCCTVEMNTTLQSNYTPIKNKLKIKHKK